MRAFHLPRISRDRGEAAFRMTPCSGFHTRRTDGAGPIRKNGYRVACKTFTVFKLLSGMRCFRSPPPHHELALHSGHDLGSNSSCPTGWLIIKPSLPRDHIIP